MARVVIIVDSATGALIDVAGHRREDSRYLKFVKRMLSLDKNPILDYGSNGGDTLEISKNGSAGKAVIVKSDVLEVTGDIKSKGKTIAEIIAERISDVTSILRGKEGEIVFSEIVDEESGNAYMQISLDEAISSTIENLLEQLEAIREMPKKYVSKQSLSDALEGIEIHDEDTLEDVKAQFSALLSRLKAISSEAEEKREAPRIPKKRKEMRMSRDQRSPRICGKCGRICRMDIERRWCPVAAQTISYRRSAESCRFYVAEYGRDARHSGKSEDDDVC